MFTWDPVTQAEIDKRKRKERIRTAILGWVIVLSVIAIAVTIRMAIIGWEYNECFWAQDVGTCLAVRNK